MERFGVEEIDAVTRVIESGELSGFYRDFKGGKMVQAFEEAFADYHNVDYAISTSSGTTALHTALLACRVGSRLADKVITTPYTFVASASSILMANAMPIFRDVNPQSYTLYPYGLQIIMGTRAIMPVHLLGHPCDMGPILYRAKTHNCKVIEDCAQALGAKYKGTLVGTLGDLGVFSFQDTKTITTGGEGGMIISNDKDLAERCQWIRNHGEKYADAEILGYNFRMTEMQAAFGLAQLEKLDKFNQTQIENAEYICKHLPEGIFPPYASKNVKHVYFLIGCIFHEKTVGITREEFLARLEKRGLVKKKPGENVSKGYDKLVYEHSVLKPYKTFCPVAEGLLKESLWIDLHRWKTRDEIENYMKTFKEVLE